MLKLLIGGSPCTHWSIAQTKDRETEPSGIGWELFRNYLMARDKFKPDFFLYENNKSMSPAIRAQITKEFGLEPILINSALVSAQSRQRLYWAGKRNLDGTYSRLEVELPEDRGILLRDVLESGVCWQEKAYTLKANYRKTSDESYIDGGHYPAPGAAEPVNVTADGKAQCLRATYYKDGIRNLVANTVDRKTCVAVPVRIGLIESGSTPHAGLDASKQDKVYSPDGKATALCGNGGGAGAKTGLYAVPVAGRVVGRRINEQGHRDDYNEEIPHFQYFEVNDNPQKTNCLTTVQKDNMIAVPVRVGALPNQNGELGTSQSRRIYSQDGKAVALQARPNGGGADGAATGLYAVPTPIEYNPLHDCDVVITDQNIRCSYKDGSGTAQGYTVYFDDVKSPSVIAGHAHKMKIIEPATGKEQPIYEVRGGLITIKDKQYPIKLADGFYIIRKLTVTECKRLQTVPDSYIFPVSDTQAYKMLGNGWTVDVIAHILSHVPGIAAEPVEVLSMYDGMSCGHIALDKLGANVTAYYATEIDKYAVQTTQKNYPETMQMGDAFAVRREDWELGKFYETEEGLPNG